MSSCINLKGRIIVAVDNNLLQIDWQKLLYRTKLFVLMHVSAFVRYESNRFVAENDENAVSES